MSSRTLGAEASSVDSRALTESRVRDLLDQQAALRELAVAVAEMRAPEVIYELVAKEAAGVAGVDSGAVVRFRVDGVAEVVGSWRMGGRQTGTLIPLDGPSGVAIVARTGRSGTHERFRAIERIRAGGSEAGESVGAGRRRRADPRAPRAVGLPARCSAFRRPGPSRSGGAARHFRRSRRARNREHRHQRAGSWLRPPATR